MSRRDLVPLAREAIRTGLVAGIAMIPFAAVFRSQGLRINEYGAKTLELLVGQVSGPPYFLLTFVQHMIISCGAAVPLVLLLGYFSQRRDRALVGLVYGAVFYAAVNSLALPIAFGDPTPWQLGFDTVYPSLFVHLVYGVVIGLLARPVATGWLGKPGSDAG